MSGFAENRSEEAKAANIARLRSLPNYTTSSKHRRERILSPQQLPTWVKSAINMHEIDGHTWRQICKKKGKAEKTLATWLSCPGAKVLRKTIADVVADPVGTAKLLAQMDAVWVYRESAEHYRIAKEAGDHAEAGRMLRHFSELNNTKQSAGSSVTPVIQVNVTTQLSTDRPTGDSSHEVIDADVEVLP